MCVCVCVCARARACVRVSVSVSVSDLKALRTTRSTGRIDELRLIAAARACVFHLNRVVKRRTKQRTRARRPPAFLTPSASSHEDTRRYASGHRAVVLGRAAVKGALACELGGGALCRANVGDCAGAVGAGTVLAHKQGRLRPL